MFYVLTTNKTTACYTAILKYIEDYIFKLEPDEIITDFEAGLRLAINNYFPRVILRGCWYHYCARLRQRFAILGLKSLLKSNANAGLIKKEFMSLPLLPAEKFTEGFEHIKRITKDFGLSEQFKSFFEYFTYWIHEVFFVLLGIVSVCIHLKHQQPEVEENQVLMKN